MRNPIQCLVLALTLLGFCGQAQAQSGRQTTNPSRSSCRSTRRQRARPSIADGRELDNGFTDCDSTRVRARSIHRLYIEGSGGNLSPHSFHPTVRIIGADPTVPPLPELRRGPLVPVGGDNAELGKQHSRCVPPQRAFESPACSNAAVISVASLCAWALVGAGSLRSARTNDPRDLERRPISADRPVPVFFEGWSPGPR